MLLLLQQLLLLLSYENKKEDDGATCQRVSHYYSRSIILPSSNQCMTFQSGVEQKSNLHTKQRIEYQTA